MHILAIRGENLASLSEAFEIDLTAEPLASAGLFAITGNTGSGKSTLLDAMCLALYSDCPRLSAEGVDDDVPDQSGEKIKSRDSRSILRHGVIMGWAEVDFLANTGKRWRARWTARRARGKAEGRLQSVERVLTDLSEDMIVENQPTAVNRRIVEITGLTYEEFRRTRLLAQGDFDAFLRAGTGARAALLEKVTGTEHYRAISRRVYERNEAVKAELERLRTRFGEHKVMTPQERETIGQNIVSSKEMSAGITAGLKILAEDSEKHRKAIASAERVSEAEGLLSEQESAVRLSSVRRGELSLVERAQGLRHLHVQVAGAAKAQAAHEDTIRSVGQVLAGISAAEDQAMASCAAAAVARDGIEAACDAFAPAWQEAARLDGKVDDLSNLANNAAQQQVIAAKTEMEANAATHTIEMSLSQSKDVITALETWRDAHAAIAGISEGWNDFSDRAVERISVGKRMAAEETTLKSRIEERARLKPQLDSISQREVELLGEMLASDQERERNRSQLAEIETLGPRRRLDNVIAMRADTRDMIGCADRHDMLLLEQDGASRRRADAVATLGASQERLAVLSVDLAAAEAAVSALLSPVQLAEASISDAAVQLRAGLDDGQPCPVCGSNDHPGHIEGALAELAAKLRSDLSEARSRADNAKRDKGLSEVAVSTATEAIRLADAELERIVRQSGELTTTYAGIRDRVAIGSLSEKFPEEITGSSSSLKQFLSWLEERQSQLEGKLKEEELLRKAADALQVKRDTCQKEIDLGRERKTRISDQLARLEKEEAILRQSIASCQDAMERSGRRISIVLQLAGIVLEDLDREGEALIRRLAKRVEDWKTNAASIQSEKDKLASLHLDAAKASAEQKSCAAAARAAESVVKDLHRQLEAARELRSGLLGGEATDKHRKRHEDSRREHAKALAEANEALAGLQNRKAVAIEQMQTAERNLSEQSHVHRTISAELGEAMLRVGVPVERLDELLARDDAWIAAERIELDRIVAAHARAEANLSQRRADHEILIAAGLPEASLADLETSIAMREKELNSLLEAVGALTARLAADDAVRQQLAGLEAQIDAAQAECETWAAVNAAVGQKNGNKFAQIAQAVTLSMLVDDANEHLRMLKPRYRLIHGGEDLSLQVVDADMADEVRSTRNMSGGERFLVSLSLALALSGMGGQGGGLAGTLFIDEGFGSLDAKDLDIAIDALEQLQLTGRTIGVISHVEAMKHRIPVQIRVDGRGGGKSRIRITDLAA